MSTANRHQVRLGRGVVVAATLLALASCTGDDGASTDAAPTTPTGGATTTGRPSPSPTSSPATVASPTVTPSPTPTAVARTTTFAPVVTEFACDCLSMPATGVSSEGSIAIVRDIPGPGSAEASPTLVVVGADGTIRWEQEIDPPSVSGVPEAPVVATEAGIAAPIDGGLVGFDWEGERTWRIDDVAVKPRVVAGAPDLVVVAGLLFADGEFESHPRVSLIDLVTGEPRWSGEDVDDYTIDEDGGALLTARYADGGARLGRVDLATGDMAEVEVADWKGPGNGLEVRDGVVSTFIGPPGGDAQRRTIAVEDWDTSPSARSAELPDGGLLEAPKGATEVATNDDASLMLVARPATGTPETAQMLDADGEVLWEKPAAEVVSWQDGEEAYPTAQISGTAEQSWLVVSRRPTFEPPTEGAVAADGAAATDLLDAATGELLWTWGDADLWGQIRVVPQRGVAVVAEAGRGQQVEPTPWTVAVLDLQTGEPDWVEEGDDSRGTRVLNVSDSIVVEVQDNPWLLLSPATVGQE